MDVELFNYDLPQYLIAQKPHLPRDECKLLVYDKQHNAIKHKIFKDIAEYLSKGDLLVLNNTKVIPARIISHKRSGGAIEIFLLKKLELNKYLCLTKGKIKQKTTVILKNNKEALIEKTNSDKRVVTFLETDDINSHLMEIGDVPLPPYIKRDYSSYNKIEDYNNYQTVFAKEEGAIAAPTAGIHFTDNLLDLLGNKGVNIAYITLHVGIGTFRPVKTKSVEEHIMHEEYYSVNSEAAEIYNKTKSSGRRIIAVGTTTVRTLESSAKENGLLMPQSKKTNIFIYPGYKYKAVDAMITNFHLPKSTLLMMISAFAGRKNMLKCYEEAIKNNYRFFSFGDAMLII